jgi:hypothetical protein
LKNETLKLEDKIKETKEQLKELREHYKRLSSNNLSGFQIKSKDSIKKTHSLIDRISSKQIPNESILHKSTDFSRRTDKTKNEIKNQQKSNINNCEIIKKKKI